MRPLLTSDVVSAARELARWFAQIHGPRGRSIVIHDSSGVDIRVGPSDSNLLELAIRQHRAIDFLLARLLEKAPMGEEMPHKSPVWPVVVDGKRIIEAAGGKL